MDTIHKIGRRKTAVARVYVSEGKGNITVNKKDFKDYFTTATLQYKVEQALMLTDNLKSYDTYTYDLAYLNTKLSYRVGAFTSKEKFKLLLDSKSPLSTSSVFVPPEDYTVILNSSSPIKKLTYITHILLQTKV